MKGQLYSVFSGLFASMASLCGKFAMASDEAMWLCENIVNSATGSTDIDQQIACRGVIIYVRVAFFLLLLLNNAIMWTTFVKALHHSNTSLEATVTNTAANFFFTAIFGQVLFGEFLTLLWWLGTVLIIFGLLLMHAGNQQLLLAAKRTKKN